ncbi:uncharacterized protein JCM15063_003580 [Sporobolomyces koalae]|uniref:uncharacterized protein n=1 Tax=Sporobolomyces koalae TaxID=500713 RepID=UPI00317AF669
MPQAVGQLPTKILFDTPRRQNGVARLQAGQSLHYLSLPHPYAPTMNDSRFPVFRKHKDRVSSSSLLPQMQERRVLKPPLSSRSSGGGMPKSSRLPKPSSSRPSSSRPSISRPISQHRSRISQPSAPTSSTSISSSKAGKGSSSSSSSLAYLDHTPRTSSLTSLPTLASRRNLSLSNVTAALPRPVALDARPHSFPPQKRRQNPIGEPVRRPARSTQDPVDPALDPFKIHANRVLRPSASSVDLRSRRDRDSTASSFSVASMPFPPRSSSLTNSIVNPSLTQPNSDIGWTSPNPSSSSLRRTATVRSATRMSTASSPSLGRTVRGPASRRKPSISGTESFLMARSTSSISTGSMHFQEHSRRKGRARGSRKSHEQRDEEIIAEEISIDVNDESPASKALVEHWKAFVASPLLDQTPPTSTPFDSPVHLAKAHPGSPSRPIFSPNEFSSAPELGNDRARKVLSISSVPRELSQTLPQTNHYLHTRTASYSTALSSANGLDATGMTRVDSEVLLTRLTLKRLGSTGFEGDALDRLGRSAGGASVAGDDTLDLELDEWADRYRDSYDGWQPALQEDAVVVRPDSPPSPTYSTSSSSSSSRSSTMSRRAWKWNPGTGNALLPKSESSSTMSSSTSIGTLSRNWSKSTLMEELEKEVGRLSRDFERDGGDRLEWSEPRHEGGAGDEDEYVCALDLIFENSCEEDEVEHEVEVPVRRGGGPLLAPLGGTAVSRLPRPKPSSGSLRPSNPVVKTGPPPVPSLPSGFVSKLVQPSSVSSKFRFPVQSRAGWV